MPEIRRTWQVGGFAGGGFVPFYSLHSRDSYTSDISLDFASAGLEVGRTITGLHGPGLLRGQGEAMAEVIPFWIADYPSQTLMTYYPGDPNPEAGPFGPYARHGVSVTPLLFRWNFQHRRQAKFVPWAQLGGGLLWTNHKFPLLALSTSVINFTPQAGIGENIFVRKHQSLEFAVKAVHISNASLGDSNPGINASLQFSLGYSWWK